MMTPYLCHSHKVIRNNSLNVKVEATRKKKSSFAQWKTDSKQALHSDKNHLGYKVAIILIILIALICYHYKLAYNPTFK